MFKLEVSKSNHNQILHDIDQFRIQRKFLDCKLIFQDGEAMCHSAMLQFSKVWWTNCKSSDNNDEFVVLIPEMSIAVGAKLVNDVYSGISFENNLQFEVYDCNNNSSVDDTADVSKSLDTPVKVDTPSRRRKRLRISETANDNLTPLKKSKGNEASVERHATPVRKTKTLDSPCKVNSPRRRSKRLSNRETVNDNLSPLKKSKVREASFERPSTAVRRIPVKESRQVRGSQSTSRLPDPPLSRDDPRKQTRNSTSQLPSYPRSTSTDSDLR